MYSYLFTSLHLSQARESSKAACWLALEKSSVLLCTTYPPFSFSAAFLSTDFDLVAGTLPRKK